MSELEAYEQWKRATHSGQSSRVTDWLSNQPVHVASNSTMHDWIIPLFSLAISLLAALFVWRYRKAIGRGIENAIVYVGVSVLILLKGLRGTTLRILRKIRERAGEVER